MSLVFDGSSRPIFKRREDMDGKVWLWANAVEGATADVPYALHFEEAYIRAKAIADDTLLYYVGVPQEAVASGVLAEFQIGGYKAAMVNASLSITAISLSVAIGHGLRITDGDVADAGSDFALGTADFAICAEATTSSGTTNVVLVPERITGT